MNGIATRALPYQGQYIALFKRVHKAAFETVEENGKPTRYPTEDKARLAAWEALAASGHLTSLMRRDGITISDHRAVAERLFARDNGEGKDEGATTRQAAQIEPQGA